MTRVEPYTESKDFTEPYTESKDFVEVEGTTRGVTMEQVLALMADAVGMTEEQVIDLIGEHGLSQQMVRDLIELTKEDILEIVQDYEGLLNLPKINGIEIKGDRRLIDYGYDTVSNIELEDLLK